MSKSTWDWCWGAKQTSAIHDDKLYIVGGHMGTGEKKKYLFEKKQYSNTNLLAVDLTKDASLNSTTPYSKSAIPVSIPALWDGVLWPTKDSLFLTGGMLSYFNIPDPKNTTRALDAEREPPAGRSFEYSFDTNKWTTVKPDPAVPKSISRSANTFSQKANKGFILGGSVLESVYTRTNGKEDMRLGDEKSTYLSNLVTYDAEKKSWTNEAASIDHTEFATLTAIDEVGEQGVLVVAGGTGIDAKTWRDFKTVQVYDVASKTWYNQETSAEGGFFPPTRMFHCAVGVSSEDKSVHNIYIYGGYNAELGQLDDVWVLSLPAFHWVKVGTSPDPRERMTCQLAGNGKYLVRFGGTSKDDNMAECDNDKGAQLLDLSTLKWGYDFKEEGGYEVPEKVYSIIGGDKTGNGNFTVPKAGFSKGLDELFVTQKQVVDPSNNSTSDAPAKETDDTSSGIGGGAIAGIVVGVVAFIALIGLIFFLVRRRKTKSARYDAENSHITELATPKTDGKFEKDYDVKVPPTPAENNALIEEKRTAAELEAQRQAEMQGDGPYRAEMDTAPPAVEMNARPMSYAAELPTDNRRSLDRI
ncbi:hypothetical protein BJ508DRAFT_411527 [Ascobolus immersus RN42]|uniref:Galactose oxidase n=1 Tax=Ascobolus immersus RN42 TaxID=1160509 RepID=A0A3N4IKJ3_ASCIM|nr:hypothetical protein BJ508DRAFT_411527 [Ascobolus immersus RN42]